MGVISTIGKIVLVVMNMLILLLSLAMIIIGIIIVSGSDVYKSLVDAIKEALKKTFEEMNNDVNVDDMTLNEFFIPLAYALIAVGIVLGTLSLLGCIGGCYTIKVVLIIYVIATTIIFLAQVILVIILYVDKSSFDKAVKPRIKDSLKSYSGIEGTDSDTITWNAIMNYEKCCGVDSYEDFKNLENWPPPTVKGQPAGDTLKTPIICCKTKPTNSDFSCARQGTANDENNWMSTGCYDKMYEEVTTSKICIIIIAAILALQFLLIFFTIWILCTMDNKVDIF